MNRRVVVTGMGVISPLGNTVLEFWESLCKGKSGIDTITRFDITDFSTKFAGCVDNFDPEDYMDKKDARRMDRYTHYAMAATRMAMQEANFDMKQIDKERLGVVLGTGVGGIETMEEQKEKLISRGPGRISPFFVPMMISNMAAGQIAIAIEAKGVNTTVVTACASATNAIGEAYRMIKDDRADVIVAGGSEAAVTPLALAGFCAMRALSTRNEDPKGASRPFDKDRDGFVMGEGAGILILEDYEHAIKRDANILAEVVGYGLTADAYHITAPASEGEGAARAMALAIQDAGIEPNMIDYINAHGTSTPYNDEFETMAIKTVFGDHAYKLCISSTKSMTGHLLGASGGIEAVATVLSLVNQYVHPTINYETADPNCDLDYVPNNGRKTNIQYAISNSFGFGGQNASLLFKRFD
ncbi:MAG TPA: beta-ketoacyl-ACP synthase II [Clostridiales bacterium]|nr:beta-ketoacyl-ACP synthase II [Clostridiales bacterium]